LLVNYKFSTRRMGLAALPSAFGVNLNHALLRTARGPTWHAGF